MNNKDPFDPLIKNLNDILQQTRDKAGESFSDKPLDPEILKKLALLENLVIKMQEDANAELEKKGLSDGEKMEKALFDETEKSKMKAADRAILDKTMDITRDAMGIKYALEMSRYMKLNASRKQFDKTKSSKEDVKKRKSKFKNMGGNDSWKKL